MPGPVYVLPSGPDAESSSRSSCSSGSVRSHLIAFEVMTALSSLSSRLAPALVTACLVLVACGGSEMTLSEYGAELESLVANMNARLELGEKALESEPATVELIRTWADDRMVARNEFMAAFNALTPPDEAKELSRAAAESIAALVAAEQEMVDEIHRIDDLATLQQIWSSPTGQAARAADEKAVAICRAAQAAMDATAGRAQFAGTPWVPAELQEVVQVAFGCRPADR